MSIDAVHQIYVKHAKQNADSDQITFNYVSMALQIFDHAFSDAFVTDLVANAESDFGLQSPFMLISQIHALMGVADGDMAQLRWLFAAVDDLHRSNSVAPGELSVRNIKGTNCAKGMGHLLLMKMGMRDCLFNQIDRMDFRADVKAHTKEVLSSHVNYRIMLAPYGDPSFTTGPGLQWMCGWSKAEEEMLRLLEEMCARVHGGVRVACMCVRVCVCCQYCRFSLL